MTVFLATAIVDGMGRRRCNLARSNKRLQATWWHWKRKQQPAYENGSENNLNSTSRIRHVYKANNALSHRYNSSNNTCNFVKILVPESVPNVRASDDKIHQQVVSIKPFDAHICHMDTAIMHPMPDRVKLPFVIFDIRALWRSAPSVRVPGCQKLQMTA